MSHFELLLLLLLLIVAFIFCGKDENKIDFVGVDNATEIVECQPGEYTDGTGCSEYNYRDVNYFSLSVCLSVYHPDI